MEPADHQPGRLGQLARRLPDQGALVQELFAFVRPRLQAQRRAGCCSGNRLQAFRPGRERSMAKAGPASTTRFSRTTSYPSTNWRKSRTPRAMRTPSVRVGMRRCSTGFRDAGHPPSHWRDGQGMGGRRVHFLRLSFWPESVVVCHSFWLADTGQGRATQYSDAQ